MSTRHNVERNLAVTGDVAVVEIGVKSRRYVFHDGTRIRAVEWVELGGEPRWAGPTEPALEDREEWFRTGDYERVYVREVPAPVRELVCEARE